jgi:hypothetical protein
MVTKTKTKPFELAGFARSKEAADKRISNLKSFGYITKITKFRSIYKIWRKETW